MRLFSMVIALWLAAFPAWAGNFFSGSQLQESCDREQALASGYIAGWMDKHDFDKFVMVTTMKNHMDDKRLRGAEKKMRANVCLRDSVTVTQATEVFCKYLKQNPDARRQTPSDALASAFSQVWPCPDGKD